jgi:hypothetical protein
MNVVEIASDQEPARAAVLRQFLEPPDSGET